MIILKDILKLKKIIFLLFLLSGCSTGYHSSNDILRGFTGGFDEEEGPGDLIKVGFFGNGYTDKEKVGLYLLFRSAELVKAKGKNHFVMYKSIAHAIANQPEDRSYVSTIGFKPAAVMYILTEDIPNANTFSADEIIKKHAKEVKGNE